MSLQKGHKFHSEHGFTGSAGSNHNKLCLAPGGRIKVTKANEVKVLQKHVNAPLAKAHKK